MSVSYVCLFLCLCHYFYHYFHYFIRLYPSSYVLLSACNCVHHYVCYFISCVVCHYVCLYSLCLSLSQSVINTGTISASLYIAVYYHLFACLLFVSMLLAVFVYLSIPMSITCLPQSCDYVFPTMRVTLSVTLPVTLSSIFMPAYYARNYV